MQRKGACVRLSLLKRIAIFFGIIFGLLGSIVMGLLIWLTSDAGSSTVSNKLKTEVLKNTGIEISFEKIGINLFPPRISVQAISGKDKRGRFQCTVDEAELSPNFIALLSRELVVEEVYLGAPRCAVFLRTEDLDALRKQAPNQPTPTFKISDIPKFDVLAVSNAELRLDLKDPDEIGLLHAEVTEFGLDVTEDENGIEVRCLLKQASGTWQKGEKQVAEKMTGLEFRAAVSNTAVDVRYLSAVIADAKVRVRDAHIPLPLWPTGPDAADVSIELPLDTLNRLPLGLPTFTGSVSLSTAIGISMAAAKKPSVTATGRVEALGIEVDDFVIGDIITKVAVTPSGLSFNETELSTAEGNIKLKGNVAFKDKLPISVRADLSNIELGRLLEQVTVDGSYVTQYMTGPVRLTGNLAPLSLSGNIKIDVRDHTTRTGSFRTKDFMTAISIPRATVTGPVFITDKTFEGKALSVKSGQSQVTVSLFFDFPGFSWRLQADSTDLHLEDVKTILGFEVGGHGPVHCSIWGPINDPHIHGEGNFSDAKLKDMAFDRVSTDINFHDLLLSFDGLEIARKTTRVSTEQLGFDFSVPGGPSINTKIDVERAAVETLMEVFHIDAARWGSPTGLLFGRLALHYRLKPEQLEVSADMVHDKMQVFGEHFGPDVLRVEWNNGALVVNELGLTKGRGTVYITGAMRPDGTMSFVGNANGVTLSSINNDTFL